MTGNSPSGSAPDNVKASVWHTPVATMRTRTSPDLGPARSTSSILSGLSASQATAALVFIDELLIHGISESNSCIDKQQACQPISSAHYAGQSITCDAGPKTAGGPLFAVFLIRHSLCFKNVAAALGGSNFMDAARSRRALPPVSNPTQSATLL